MRENHKIQPTLTEPWLDLPHAKELKAISDLLDQHPMLGRAGGARHLAGGSKRTGGLTGDQVLRAMIVKQMNGFSYDELAFHLADSQTYQNLLPGSGSRTRPRSARRLAENIKRIKASTLEQINRILVAREGSWDRTGSEGPCRQHSVRDEHPPAERLVAAVRLCPCADSTHGCRQEVGGGLRSSFRTACAERSAAGIGIHRARGKRQRRKLYRDLVNVTEEVFAAAIAMLDAVCADTQSRRHWKMPARLEAIIGDLERYLPLTSASSTKHAAASSTSETVPATEKLVSIFEEHTDIIVKAPRKTQFGHKVTLTGGASSMILDCVIARGQPCRFIPCRHHDRTPDRHLRTTAPLKASFDGGYASQANLETSRPRGSRTPSSTRNGV